jgi:hypothetical protein
MDAFPWPGSTEDRRSLEQLVLGGLLTPAGDGPIPVWMVPPSSDRELNPLPGYVVSFLRLHKRGFNAPASKFMRGLCHHYGVELHNFTSNAVDGPYNKLLTVNISATVPPYNEFHACFRC